METNILNNLEMYKFFTTILLSFICLASSAQVWTNKTISNEIVLHKSNITIGYNTKYNIPNYVGEVLTYKMTVGGASRGKFITDYTLPVDNRITTQMYTNSGYDRGHLAPAADFKFNQSVMNESFYMSNICPQTPSLNQKYWVKVEDKVRSLTQKCDTLFVITGTIGNAGTIYNKKIVIPKRIYKAVIGVKNGTINCSVAFIYNNDNSAQQITTNTYTINKLEQIIHRDLFFELQKRYYVAKAEGKIMLP